MSQTAKLSHYVIRGGVAGRERLRILGRVMRPSTLRLFDYLGVRENMACLDVGCGGGDVTLELARIVGPGGKVVGIDMDETKLEILRQEAAAQQLTNIETRLADAATSTAPEEFDLVYARFLLTHLADPRLVLRKMWDALRPGGMLAVVDIDCQAFCCYPEAAAFSRFVELYIETVRRRGGDPNIGPRLPSLISELQLHDVRSNVVQPLTLNGEAKLIPALTMEAITEAVLTDGLATKAEIDALVDELRRYASNPSTLTGLPRCFEAWGRKPEHA